MKVVKTVLIIILVAGVLEIISRQFWFTTCSGEYNIEKIEPVDVLKPDSLLGYKYTGDKMKVKYLNGFTFGVTMKNGLRVTSDLQHLNDSVNRKKVWVFGDSFFWGWGVEDSCYLFALMAKKYHGLEIQNYSNPGYSAAVNYLQLVELEKNNPLPKLIIFQFESYDKGRIILSPLMRKNISVSNEHPDKDKFYYPYADIENEVLTIGYKKMPVNEKDLRCYSSLANFIDDLTRFTLSSMLDEKADRVTQKLIQELITFCKLKNVKIIITSRYVDDKDLKFFDSVIDNETSFFLKYNSQKADSLTLKPYDNHPNCIGHRFYFEDISSFITTHSILQ